MRRGRVVVAPVRALQLEDFYDFRSDTVLLLEQSEARITNPYCVQDRVSCKWLGRDAKSQTYLGRWFAHTLFPQSSNTCPSKVAVL